MVIIGVNKINLFFDLGKKEFTTFYCPGWNNTRVNFLSFQFSLAHSNDGFLPSNKQCHFQLLLGFFFSYTDINSEGNFSFNFYSCSVILACQSLMSHLILSQDWAQSCLWKLVSFPAIHVHSQGVGKMSAAECCSSPRLLLSLVLRTLLMQRALAVMEC